MGCQWQVWARRQGARRESLPNEDSEAIMLGACHGPCPGVAGIGRLLGFPMLVGGIGTILAADSARASHRTSAAMGVGPKYR